MILVWLILIPFIAGLLSWQAELRFGHDKSPALDRRRANRPLMHIAGLSCS